MTRPRRAVLFVPATDRKKIEKAAALGADSVVIDCEDGVALSRKAAARVQAAAALAELDFGASERLVRVNPRGSGHQRADVAAIGEGPRLPDGIVLPKAESGDEVRALSERLAEIEAGHEVAPGTLRILPIIETARGVVRLEEIATADPRVEALIFGSEDLCGDIGATRTREGREIAYARSAVVLHCAAFRLQAIDTVFVDLGDEAGLVAETRDALGLGYTGKLAIHPKQVGSIVAVFTPPPNEIGMAERLLAEHRRHQAEGRGVFSLDGKMVDMPMVRAAERVLARARAAGVLPGAPGAGEGLGQSI